MYKLIFFILLEFCFVFGQTKNPDQILKEVKDKFDKVSDYVVNVDVKVDVSFLKIPETRAKIYFKQPDKVRVFSENFALLPKEGLNFSPLSFLKQKYTAVFGEDTLLNGHKVSVIKIIPLNERSNIILTTLWIDQTKDVIRKAESVTKFNGTFSLEFSYKNSPDGYALPSKMTFTFNTGNQSMPQMFPGDETDSQPQEKKQKRNKKLSEGKVYISYSNYNVNKGIPDSIFTAQKEK